MRWSHELIRIPPFGRQPVEARGGLAYVEGNVPFIAFEEGSDLMRLRTGQAVPVLARKVSLLNPFSVTAEVQVMRGPDLVAVGSAEMPDHRTFAATRAKASTVIQNVAGGGPAAGRRRGIGLMSKRGRFHVNYFNTVAATDVANEIMVLPKASVAFLPLRPAAAFNTSIPCYRPDGSINDELVCIAGSYTQAEIDTWKAAAGYTAAEIKHGANFASGEFQVGPDLAAFVTVPETVVLKTILDIRDMGDVSLFTVR